MACWVTSPRSPIPEVISGINATMLGAWSVNPKIKVKIIWVNTWFNPGKEADAAKALADQGCDVLMQHTDSPAAMQIAEQRHIFAFGQDSDMIKFGPHSQLTSIVDNWAPYYIERAKEVLAGTWKSTDTWGGLKSNLVVMAPFTNMPADVKAVAEKTEAGLKDGSIHPFKCPVIAQDGSTVPCKGGTRLSDGQILGMNFYVKGMTRSSLASERLALYPSPACGGGCGAASIAGCEPGGLARDIRRPSPPRRALRANSPLSGERGCRLE